jgi:hypothetical protein
VPPSSEEALLGEYANDAALALAPAGATRRGEPERQAACYRVGGRGREGVSRTSVTVQYDLARDLGPEEGRALVEAVATRAGWTLLEAQTSGLDSPIGGVLRYCRTVLGEPSFLEVIWQHTIDPDGDSGRVVPGVLTTTVYSPNVDPQRGDRRCSN